MAGGKPFQPGQSGNPGGRRKQDLAVKDYAKAHTQLAIDTLAEICENKKYGATSRAAAAVALLDRGWGRPAQSIIGGDEDDPPLRMIARIELVPMDGRGTNPASG